MVPLLQWSRSALLAALALPAPPSPSPPPPPPPPVRPISESAERIVERMEEERMAPCRKAIEEGRPCFPITAAVRGPDASVREGLERDLARPGGPRPNRPPTPDELRGRS